MDIAEWLEWCWGLWIAVKELGGGLTRRWISLRLNASDVHGSHSDIIE